MKVLFVVPPFWRLLGSHNNAPSLGVHILAEIVHAAGHEAIVYNCDWVDSDTYASWSSMMCDEDRYQYVLNESPMWGNFKRDFAKIDPDVIGITAQGGIFDGVNRVAALVREVSDAKIVVGGPLATLAPWKFKFADTVVRGEAEDVILDVLTTNAPQVDGGTPALNRVPFLGMDRLYFPVSPALFNTVQMQRGCYWKRCIFCSTGTLLPGPVRRKDPSVAVAEVWHRHNRYGVTHFAILDESFTGHPQWAKEVSGRMGGLGVTWICEARADELMRSPWLPQVMKENGCVRVKIGLEAVNDSLLEYMHKGITLKMVTEVTENLHRVGLPFTLYLMLGWPGVEDSEYREWYEFARDLNADWYTTNITVPHVATELREMVNIEHLPGHCFMHLSNEVRKFWGISREIVDLFLSLNVDRREE